MGRKRKCRNWFQAMSLDYIYVVTLVADDGVPCVVGSYSSYDAAERAIDSGGWKPTNNAVNRHCWYHNDEPGMRYKWLRIRKVPFNSIDWHAMNSA